MGVGGGVVRKTWGVLGVSPDADVDEKVNVDVEGS